MKGKGTGKGKFKGKGKGKGATAHGPDAGEPILTFMPGATTLLLDRGDYPSLATLAVQSDPEAIVLWHLREGDASAERRLEAVETHRATWGIDRLVVAEAASSGVPDLPPPAELFKSSMLLQAVTAARQLRCRRVLWPVLVGPTGEGLAREVDRAETVLELADLAEATQTVRIDLPVADLDARQAVELIDDAGAPMGAAWPCDGGGPEPCGRCAGCRRWRGAFDELGTPWPWTAAGVG